LFSSNLDTAPYCISLNCTTLPRFVQ